ncbi:hypothetical protein [Rhizobium mongolense]
MTVSAPTYKNHRYPIEIVARAVWLGFGAFSERFGDRQTGSQSA